MIVVQISVRWLKQTMAREPDLPLVLEWSLGICHHGRMVFNSNFTCVRTVRIYSALDQVMIFINHVHMIQSLKITLKGNTNLTLWSSEASFLLFTFLTSPARPFHSLHDTGGFTTNAFKYNLLFQYYTFMKTTHHKSKNSCSFSCHLLLCFICAPPP